MATETASMPVNGNYAPHQAQGYGATEQLYPAQISNASAPVPSGYGAAPSSSGSNATTTNGHTDIPKDEVGWYFVEQYYTTLSRSPEKLYLFYNKRSQFVSGVEEEKAPVCVGQKAINDRIKELDFQDCKVRVTNVDSQGSDQNIVIQVMGGISNKSQPHRKFVQTFVLAEQTNGYFVLNDIFRYINEDEEEVETEDVQQDTTAVPEGGQEPDPIENIDSEPKGLTSSTDPAAQEHDAAEVDKQLEEVLQEEKPVSEPAPPSPAPAEQVNGTEDAETVETAPAEEQPAAPVSEEEPQPPQEQVVEAAAAAAAEETAAEEKPKDPEPTPVMSPKRTSPAPPAVPSAPPKPAAPLSWASRAAAANRVATPAVPVLPTPSAAPSQPKATPTASAPAQSVSTPPSAPSAPAVSTPPARDSSDEQEAGWQAVGSDHNKNKSRGQSQAASTEPPVLRSYIKNVYEGVTPQALREALSKHGKVTYLDIARQKNCAFVDWATQEDFQAAVAANPHQVGEHQLYVEERRMGPKQMPYHPRGGMGRGRGDGRGGAQGRGGFNRDGGRGGFGPRGRGGNVTPRGGRGGSQAA